MTQDLLARAMEARRRGDNGEAKRLLDTVLARQPGHAVALNSLGLIALGAGDPLVAAAYFERAGAADPKAPPIWLNLAQAYRSAGDGPREIAALDRALAIDPYLLPASLQKAQALERLGRLGESAQLYRALLPTADDAANLPEPVRQALDHGRTVIAAEAARRADTLDVRLGGVRESFPDEDLGRVQAYVEQRLGRRKVYVNQPTDGHFPYLPAFEFFDRSLFPWMEALEAATGDIKRELISLWDEGNDGFSPYVAFDPTQPVNQWGELNHSPRWSAWFLWKDGVRQDANCERCPATARALEAVPLMDNPGKAPTVMFSILDPHTRIPPHTGSSNVRTTVHLPLVLPGPSRFRVGSETREWREGEAWAFDDTIEHEAWNDGDKPRAILILDVWNPLLTEAERAMIRVVG